MAIATSTWTEVARIFEDCLELDEDRVDGFLDARCRGKPDLRQAVEALLRSDREASSFLGSTALSTVPAQVVETKHHEQIGPYRVLRPLGSGGLGEVFLACRNDGAYDREVAVKLLHSRVLGGREATRRLLEERQILAQLNHPNVAQLHDGGQTADGRPYLVMEYVDGLPIDAYCQATQPSLVQRLDLFRQLCSAVEYAHRHLVVHRDLKPSNVLVTHQGQVKLLDFGIAKQLSPGIDAFTTVTGGSPMTLAYASPEQIVGKPVTTASDVHGLGLLLYLLLTGRHPFLLHGYAPHRIAAAVCTRIPSAPRRERIPDKADESDGPAAPTDPATLWRPDSRGGWSVDLDAIALRALEKKPEDRYATARQLRDDVEHYLDGRPVDARAAGLGYRAWKLLARHRRLAAVLALALAVGATFLFALVRETRRTEAALAQLEQEADAVRDVSEYLVSLFRVFDPNAAGGAVSSARDMLDYGVEFAETSLTTRPATRGEVLHFIGTAYHQLGAFHEAEQILEEALTLRREIHGDASSQVAKTYVALGRTECRVGQYEEALAHFESARQIAGSPGADPVLLAEALDGIGVAHWFHLDYEASEEHLRAARRILLEQEGPRSLRLARTTKSLANVVADRGRIEESKALVEEVLDVRSEKLPPNHPDLAVAHNNYGTVLWMLDRNKEALEHYETAAAIWREAFGPDYPGLGAAGINIGLILLGSGRYDEAAAILGETLRIAESSFGPHHWMTANAHLRLASVRLNQGDLAAALGQLELADAAIDVLAGEEPHPLLADAHDIRAEILVASGRPDDAQHHFDAALETLLAVYESETHPAVQVFCEGQPDTCRKLLGPPEPRRTDPSRDPGLLRSRS